MLIVRIVRHEDLPALIEMEHAAPTAAHWRECEYEMLLANNATPLRKTFVAEQGGQLVGFVVAKAVASEWEIENIIVVAGSQRQGIGQSLLSRLIQEAQN